MIRAAVALRICDQSSGGARGRNNKARHLVLTLTV